MIGHHFSSDGRLPERDLQDLADELAIQMHSRLGSRVYMLQRTDVAELIAPYIDDLATEDQRAAVWLVWHLFQDALDMEMHDRRS